HPGHRRRPADRAARSHHRASRTAFLSLLRWTEPVMIPTLGRYFFRRYVITTFWFLVGIFSLIFIIDFSEMANRVGVLPDYTIASGLLVTALRIPMILVQTVPFVALFAGMASLISLNRRYELVVTRAAGISVCQFLRPFAIGA